eukprot:10789814-Lingulodinium_polyedra.AAC.1
MESLTDVEFDEEHEKRNEPCSCVQCECDANAVRWRNRGLFGPRARHFGWHSKVGWSASCATRAAPSRCS